MPIATVGDSLDVMSAIYPKARILDCLSIWTRGQLVDIRDFVQPYTPKVQELFYRLCSGSPDLDHCIEIALDYVQRATFELRSEWYFPDETIDMIKAGEGVDCDPKSILLVSMLRNLTQNVWVAMGNLRSNHVGLHAWVVVERYGGLYVLEATVPLKGWKTVQQCSAEWQAAVLFNDSVLISVGDLSCDVKGDCRPRWLEQAWWVC